MAVKAGEVVAVLSLDSTGYTNGLRNAVGSLGSIIGKGGAAAAGPAGLLVAAAFVAAFQVKVASGIASALASAYEQASIYENTQASFSVLFEDSENFLGNLETYAIQTPFEMKDVEESAKLLRAYNFKQEDVLDMLTVIGDTSAATGGSIEGITMALGQMRAAQFISGEEVRQLKNVGVDVWGYISEEFGITVPEAMAKAEQKALDFDRAYGAIVDGLQDDFGGMMAVQMETASGKTDILKDSIIALQRDIGAPLVEAAKPFMDMAIPALDEISGLVRDFLEDNGPAFQRIWEDLGPIIMDFAEIGIGGIVKFVENSLVGFGNVIRIIDDVSPALKILLTGFFKFVESVGDVLLGFKKFVYEYIVMPLNSVIDLINEITGTNFSKIRMNISGVAGNEATSRSVSASGSRSLLKFADGGIADGPTSGYPVMLHGREAIVPLDGKSRAFGDSYTFNFTGTSRSDIPFIESAVRRVLRSEVRGASLAYGGI